MCSHLTLIYSPPHVQARETTFPDGGYFLPNLLRSTSRKYTCLYVQLTIDKQALTIDFGVTRFYQFLYSRPCTLYSDLIHIFNEDKSVPTATYS